MKLFRRDSFIASGANGTVIILLAIWLLAIVSLLALAIDTSRVTTAKSEQYNTASLAVLAALEEYAKTPYDSNQADSVVHSNRLLAAVERAEEIIGSAHNRLAVQHGKLQIDPTADDLGVTVGLPGRTTGTAGVLVPGEYFYSEPLDDCSAYDPEGDDTGCPCPAGQWEGACFRENTAADVIANAFELRLHSKPDSPISNVFGALMGQASAGLSSVSLASTVRATLVPNLGVYALDLSRSTSFKTHLPWESQPSDAASKQLAAEYVFQLSGTGISQCGPGHENPCDDGATCDFIDGSTEPGSQHCKFYGNTAYSQCPGLQQTRPSLPQASTAHFQDDYRCYAIDIDQDGTTEHYLIDTTRRTTTTGTYRGPEPLYTILEGLNAALVELEGRALSGDQISLIGFDDEVIDSRPGNVTNDFIGRVIGPTGPGRADFQLLKDLTDVNDASKDDIRIENGFFPRPFHPWDGGSLPPVHTDIPLGVMESRNMFSEMNLSADASRFVVMITDGLNNCVHEDTQWMDFIGIEDGKPELARPICYQTSGENRTIDSTGHWTPPINLYGFHLGGLLEASNLVCGRDPFTVVEPHRADYSDYIPRYYYMQEAGMLTYVHDKISFHSIIYGGQPSNMISKAPSEEGGCVTDEIARKYSKPFVSSLPEETAWNPLNNYESNVFHDNSTCYMRLGTPESSLCPYYTHLDVFHLMSRATGGIFYVLRKPCDMTKVATEDGTQDKDFTLGVGESCSEGDFLKKLDKLCDDTPLNNYTGCYLCPKTKVWSEDLKNAGVIDDIQNVWDYGDGNGLTQDTNHATRLICDPYCRSEAQQFTDLIKEIYSSIPIVLSDERAGGN